MTEQGGQGPDDERLRITEIRDRMRVAHLPTDDDIAGYQRVSGFFAEQNISDQEFMGYLRVLDRLFIREGGISMSIRVCGPLGPGLADG
jgi:hypothetical protein